MEKQNQERATQERTFESETIEQIKEKKENTHQTDAGTNTHRHKLRNAKSTVYVSAKNARIFCSLEVFFSLRTKSFFVRNEMMKIYAKCALSKMNYILQLV